ncbi:MAG: hypothetical protein COB85_03990 [Bacteroidetes bacterium]|nr:MAG: hypothetical protein COB85_03990 [Bacteroidota bacterium]
MKKEKQFEIKFAYLKAGLHQFSYRIDEKFFVDLNSADIIDSMLNVDVELMKEDNLLVLEFDIDGSVTVCCDRCSDNMELAIDCNNRLIVKFGENLLEETDEIIMIPAKENSIDIASYIFEYIHLQLPQRKVHEVAACNADAIKRLNGLNGKVNGEATVDPRWEVLKNLKLDS